MHDTDNDGMITLEEYRHVSPCSHTKHCLRSSFQSELDNAGLLSINIQIITLEAFGTAGETENKQMNVNSNYQD